MTTSIDPRPLVTELYKTLTGTGTMSERLAACESVRDRIRPSGSSAPYYGIITDAQHTAYSTDHRTGNTINPYYWTGRRVLGLSRDAARRILLSGFTSLDLDLIDQEHGQPDATLTYTPRNRASKANSGQVYAATTPGENRSIKPTGADVRAHIAAQIAAGTAEQRTETHTDMSLGATIATPTQTTEEPDTMTTDATPDAPQGYDTLEATVRRIANTTRATLDTQSVKTDEELAAAVSAYAKNKESAEFDKQITRAGNSSAIIERIAEILGKIGKETPRPSAPSADLDEGAFALAMQAYTNAASDYQKTARALRLTGLGIAAYIAEGDEEREKEAQEREAREEAARQLAEAEEAARTIGERMAKIIGVWSANRQTRAEKQPIPGVDVPSVNPYYEPDNLLRKIAHGLCYQMADYGKASNVLLTGPAGTGKTVFAEQLAALLGIDYLPVETYLFREARDLFGRFGATPEKGIHWIDSTFTRVLERGYCVIALEEISRADPAVANALIPLLDHRRQAYVDDADRLIKVGPCVFFTASANLGSKFLGAGGIDFAIDTRFGVRAEVDYPSEKTTASIMARKYLPGSPASKGKPSPFVLDFSAHPLHGLNEGILRALTQTVEETQKLEKTTALSAGTMVDRGISMREVDDAIQWYGLVGPDAPKFTILSRYATGAKGRSAREEVDNILAAKFAQQAGK